MNALCAGLNIEEILNLTKIELWFLTQIREMVDSEQEVAVPID